MMNALGQPQRMLVLGGTSEIAAHIVRAVATAETEVVLAGRDLESLAVAAADLGSDVASAETMHCDAADTASHEAVLSHLFRSEIDVVVIAVGVLPQHADALARPGAGVSSLAVNGLGAASLLLHCHRLLRQQGHGRIVILSSVAAVRPRPGNYVYGAGKAMADFLARGMVDTPDPRVQVLLVRPGFVHTRMTAGMRSAPFSVKPEAVGAAVASALRRGSQSAIVWVPPVLRRVAAVMAMLPMALLRRLER